MSSEWRSVTFGDVVDFSPNKKSVSAAVLGSYISTENMIPNFGGVGKATSLPASGSVSQFQVGDTLFSNIRTYFLKVWRAQFSGTCSPDVLVFRAKDPYQMYSGYLHHLCRWDVFTNYSVRTSKGAKMPRGDKNALAKFSFDLPSLDEQFAIAQILDRFDDQIILLREINETLEAIAQAIFKSWFVDFDPVKAKAAGLVPAGIDEATAALFPNSFDGPNPSGWTTSSLDQIANYLNGLALQKFPPSGVDDLPVIKIAQLRKGDTIGADLTNSSMKPEYIVHDGDVLFSWSGSLEVEIWCGGKGALNQHLFKVTSDQFEKWFYFLWTRHHLENFRQIAASKATTMGHIQRAHLTDAKVCVPSKKLLEAADAIFTPLINDIILNAQEIKTLSELRDTLLPRLISGKLRIPETQEAVEEMA